MVCDVVSVVELVEEVLRVDFEEVWAGVGPALLLGSQVLRAPVGVQVVVENLETSQI